MTNMYALTKKLQTLGVLILNVLLILGLNPAASGQFIKEIDAEGRVIYHQDPAYDYSADEPSEENRRINEEQLRRLREFNDHRAKMSDAGVRPPDMTIRTGRSVCRPKISVRRLSKLGCN